MGASPKTYRFEDAALRRTAAALVQVSTQYAADSRRIDADIRAVTCLLRDLGVEAVQCDVVGTRQAPGGRMMWDPQTMSLSFAGSPGLEMPLLALPLRLRQACHAQIEQLLHVAGTQINPGGWKRWTACQRRDDAE